MKKKLILSALAATLCFSSGMVSPFSGYAATVTQAADVLITQYPDMITQWKTGDPKLTDQHIKNFVNAVSQKVQESGEVTEENIGQKFKEAFYQIFEEGNHDRAIFAAAIAFHVDPVKKEIPAELQPMKEAIKAEILSSISDPEPDSGTTNPGTTSGTTGAGSTPSTAPAGTNPNNPIKVSDVFADVKGHWAEDAIQKMYDKGIVKGANGKVLPDHTITRAEFATFLVKTLGLTEEAEIDFKDADPSAWYFSSLAIAYQAGIMKGFGDDTIKPNDQITREQMALMVYQGLKAKGLLLSSEKEVTLNDQSKISFWASEAVQAVGAMGVITGFPDGSFQPQGQATRAQALVMLSKLIEQK